MNKKILAICDSESRYANGLMEYMSGKDNLPFRIHVFTDQERFLTYPKKEDIECLLISEHIYEGNEEKIDIPHIIILSESGNILDQTLHHIHKYQSCETIYKEVLEYYTKESESVDRKLRTGAGRMKIIGIYTPVGRCLQTTFALTLGQMISRKHKALYMNFERYSGFSTLLKRDFSGDVSDLIYYLECAREKLAYKLDTIVENIGGLDFIPPASIFTNIADIRTDQWIELFSEVGSNTGYEYLILDLSDGILELWEVLRNCDIVYTITKGDSIALAKLYQYERALEERDYEDVLHKTKKCRFPIFRNLIQKFDELTIGEMAGYIRENILEDVLNL